MSPKPFPTPGPTSTGSIAELSEWNWEALSAVATSAAVIVSLFAVLHQLRREYILRREEDQRQRRHQAGYVSAWYDKPGQMIWIENRSEQPIYDAGTALLMKKPAKDGRLFLPIGVGGGIARVVPGRHRVPVQPRADWAASPPVLAFRDSQGITWNRDHLGNLTELQTDVFTYYGIEPQYDYPVGDPQPVHFSYRDYKP